MPSTGTVITNVRCTIYTIIINDYFQSILSKYNINQSIISGYETITYYLHFAQNPIKFGQVVTQKY